MTPQVAAFYLYLALAAVIAAVFLAVAASTRRPREVSKQGANRLRAAFAVLLAVVLLSALAGTLGHMPYDLWAGEIPERVVYVTGKQFAFAVTTAPVESEEAWQEATTFEPVQVPAGSVVEFRARSLDVNHGIGIYDPGGALVGQVQAMPGYLNRLRMRFAQPGTYHLLCLEMCGFGHSNMRGVLIVDSGVARLREEGRSDGR